MITADILKDECVVCCDEFPIDALEEVNGAYMCEACAERFIMSAEDIEKEKEDYKYHLWKEREIE